MIGLISGDIIASPYNSVPTADYSSIFFPLFTAAEHVSVDMEKRRSSVRSYEPKMTTNSAVALAATEWFLHSDKEGESFRDFLGDRNVSSARLLSVCGPIVRLSGSEAEARGLVGRIFAEMKPDGSAEQEADMLTSLMWRLKQNNGFSRADLGSFLQEAGFSGIDSASLIRPFLEGTVTFGETPGHLVPGDGKKSADPAAYIVAAAVALASGESWEECVRRATAMGGDASLTASLTGALAEFRYGGVPDVISVRAKDYLDDMQRETLNAADRRAVSTSVVEGASIDELNGRQVDVIRMPGMQSVFAVEPGDVEMIEAIEASQLSMGNNYRVVSPKEFRSVYEEMSRQLDADGKVLSGVYVENHRPEIRSLWLQDGKLRSSSTRDGVRVISKVSQSLPSKAVRQRVFSEFQQFKAEVERIRTELEKSVEYNPAEYGGRHLSFPSARYPVVYDSYVEIYENGICRGRCGLNADGLFSVFTNSPEYTFHGEGIEGVLNTREFFTKGMNMKQCLAALNFFILDIGLSPDEEEAKHLKDNDEEAIAIRKKYGSNYDAVLKDMGVYFTRKEAEEERRAHPEDTAEIKLLPEAVTPSVATLSPEEKAAREARRAASEADYASRGVTDLVTLRDSEAHKGSVFTIGHSNMEMDDFIKNLKRHGIEVLCDVRSFRQSRFAPQFNEASLEKALAEAGIEYEVFDSLGGQQKGSTSRVLTYDEVVKKSAFKDDIDVLRSNARKGLRFALMCSEGDALECHRMLLIGRALAHPEYSHPQETAKELAKLEKLQEAVAVAEKAATPYQERKTRKELREQLEKIDKSLVEKRNELEKRIKNLHYDNLTAIEDAHKKLDSFNESRKYTPIDVEHIARRGYVVSQERLETDLQERYELVYKDAVSKLKDTDKKPSLLEFAFSAAEESIRDKQSAKKQVRRRLAETSKKKAYRKGFKK